MAINQSLMKEKAERAWAIIDELIAVRRLSSPEQLSTAYSEDEINHIREVAHALRVEAKELVEIADLFDKQADFADDTRDVEEIAMRVFGKRQETGKKRGDNNA